METAFIFDIICLSVIIVLHIDLPFVNCPKSSQSWSSNSKFITNRHRMMELALVLVSSRMKNSHEFSLRSQWVQSIILNVGYIARCILCWLSEVELKKTASHDDVPWEGVSRWRSMRGRLTMTSHERASHDVVRWEGVSRWRPMRGNDK